MPVNTPQPITLYKPEVKILKRTASATPPPSARKESSQTAAESLKERERRYKEVREKIFGPGGGDSEGQDSSNSRSGSPGPNNGEGTGNSNNNNNNKTNNNGGKKKNKRREKDADAEANSQLPPISIPIRAPKGPDSLGFGFGRGTGSGGRGGRGAGGGRGAAPTRGLNDGTVAAISTPVPQDPIDYITRADPTGGRGGYMMGQHSQMMQGNMMGMGYGFPQQQQQTIVSGSSNYANHLMQGQPPQMGHGQTRMMNPGLGMPINQGIQSPAVQQLWNSATGQGYPQPINTTMYPMHGQPSSRSHPGATGVPNIPNQWSTSNQTGRGLPHGVNPSLSQQSSQSGGLNPQALPHSQTIPSNPWGQQPQQQSQLQQPQHYIPSQQQATYAQQVTQNSYPQYNSLYSSQLQQQTQSSQQQQQQSTSAWGPIGRNIPSQAIPTAALGRGLPSSNSGSNSRVQSPGQGGGVTAGLVGGMDKLRLWEPGR